MLARLIIAIIIGVLVFLVCLLAGAVLGDLNVPVLDTVGSFLRQWAAVLGAIAGLLAFFTGWSPFGRV